MFKEIQETLLNYVDDDKRGALAMRNKIGMT